MNGLISIENLVPQPVEGEILALNEISQEHGLVLSEEEARELSETRTTALVENERVEAGVGAVTKIVRRFCASRYLDPTNYAYVLNEITYFFYYIKTEVDDAIGDDGLIEEMFNRFELNCRGDIDVFEAKEIERIIRKINAGKHYLEWYAEDDAYDAGGRQTPDNLLSETSDEADDAEDASDDYVSVNAEMEEEEKVDLDVFEDFSDGTEDYADGWSTDDPDTSLYDEVTDELLDEEEALNSGKLDVSYGGTDGQLSVGDAYPENFFEDWNEAEEEYADAYGDEDLEDMADEEDDFDLDAFDAFFDREAGEQKREGNNGES